MAMPERNITGHEDPNITSIPAHSASELRPHTTVILAMSADGKIADSHRHAARFGSDCDKYHLEQQIAGVDGVLFGAGTLRAYGTSLRVRQPELLHQRQQQGKPLQPIQMVCSKSARLDPRYPFFRQPFPRWLLTTPDGKQRWQDSPGFERILTCANATGDIDWAEAFGQLQQLGVQTLAVLGGGNLIASLLGAGLVDELWLTVCPLLLGGGECPNTGWR